MNSNCPLHWLSHQVIVLILPFLFFFLSFLFFLFFGGGGDGGGVVGAFSIALVLPMLGLPISLLWKTELTLLLACFFVAKRNSSVRMQAVRLPCACRELLFESLHFGFLSGRVSSF